MSMDVNIFQIDKINFLKHNRKAEVPEFANQLFAKRYRYWYDESGQGKSHFINEALIPYLMKRGFHIFLFDGEDFANKSMYENHRLTKQRLNSMAGQVVIIVDHAEKIDIHKHKAQLWYFRELLNQCDFHVPALFVFSCPQQARIFNFDMEAPFYRHLNHVLPHELSTEHVQAMVSAVGYEWSESDSASVLKKMGGSYSYICRYISQWVQNQSHTITLQNIQDEVMKDLNAKGLFLSDLSDPEVYLLSVLVSFPQSFHSKAVQRVLVNTYNCNSDHEVTRIYMGLVAKGWMIGMYDRDMLTNRVWACLFEPVYID